MADFLPNMEEQKNRLAAAVAEAGKDKASQGWLEPREYLMYTDKGSRTSLYHAYADEELLDILRRAAAELGRMPSKRDVFCIWREFIIWRFANWPKALMAAGLKAPKKERRAMNVLRMEQNRQAEAAYLAGKRGQQ